jgi:hypothetical protein
MTVLLPTGLQRREVLARTRLDTPTPYIFSTVCGTVVRSCFSLLSEEQSKVDSYNARAILLSSQLQDSNLVALVFFFFFK